MRFEDQSAELEWLPTEMQTLGRHQPVDIKRQRKTFETVSAAAEYATTALPAGSLNNATIRVAGGPIVLYRADIEAMSKSRK
jgi:hypothetical protein